MGTFGQKGSKNSRFTKEKSITYKPFKLLSPKQ
jgi:hypothetical protein